MEVEFMGAPDINGAWQSKLGKLIYFITQIDDRFVWCVVHGNGVTETGLGWFTDTNAENANPDVHAQWNFHEGDLGAGVRSTHGTVILVGGKATAIKWDDLDDFQRVQLTDHS
jgi:hypothetical protein